MVPKKLLSLIITFVVSITLTLTATKKEEQPDCKPEDLYTLERFGQALNRADIKKKAFCLLLIFKRNEGSHHQDKFFLPPELLIEVLHQLCYVSYESLNQSVKSYITLKNYDHSQSAQLFKTLLYLDVEKIFEIMIKCEERPLKELTEEKKSKIHEDLAQNLQSMDILKKVVSIIKAKTLGCDPSEYSGAEINTYNFSEPTLFAFALCGSTIKMGVYNRNSLAHHAAFYPNSTWLLELLVKNGANFNLINDDGATPLYKALEENNVACAKFLIEKGALVNTQNYEGNTPLHIACYDENESGLCQLILDHNADLTLTNFNNETPLHIACQKGHHDAVKLLIENKANINVQNKFKETPLHHACSEQFDECVTTLLENNADPSITNKESETALHLSSYENDELNLNALLNHKADINAKLKNGNEPIHLVEDDKAIKLLIEKNANINQQNNFGDRPVHLAVKKSDPQLLETLTQNNADINGKNYLNQTPLHTAVSKQNKKVIEKLIKLKADPHAKNLQGQTPYEQACAHGLKEKIDALFPTVDINQLLENLSL